MVLSEISKQTCYLPLRISGNNFNDPISFDNQVAILICLRTF